MSKKEKKDTLLIDDLSIGKVHECILSGKKMLIVYKEISKTNHKTIRVKGMYFCLVSGDFKIIEIRDRQLTQ